MDRRFIVLIAICMLLFGCSKQLPQLPLDVDNDGGFRLTEISVSEAVQRQPQLAYCGSRELLGFTKTEYWNDCTIPKKEVKRYPQFKGSKPLYGSLKFKSDYLKPKSGFIEYQFAVDATGSEGYDLLYFDANRDLDLTNDRPLRAGKTSWPNGLWPREMKEGRILEPITLPVDFGPGYGVRPVNMLPLILSQKESAKYSCVRLVFICLSFRAGRIKIADKEFDAILAQDVIPGSFNWPYTHLYLMEPGKTAPFENWFGSESLRAYRFINGKYYTTSASPTGDKLFVKPYTGELGVLKIDSGRRGIDEVSVSGSLESPTAAVAIGKIEQEKQPPLQPVTEWHVPVGDYFSNDLLVRLGSLRIDLMLNLNDQKIDPDWAPKLSIKIRPNQPFVLDFANKPDALFVSPSKDAAFKPGDEIEVKAVLIDPPLDIRVRGLDTLQKPTEELKNGEVQNNAVENFKSLEPTVIIADSSGNIVAEGTMPFG